MNEDLLDTEKLESQELKQQYDRMLQNIDRNFNGREKGLVKIESVDHLQFEAVRFLSEGKKVVILDANGMFQNADIDPVFNDRFCVIDSEIKNDLDPEKEAQFINLYGLSNLGIGILFRNGDIFRNAYIAITGTAPDEAILKEVLMGNLPVINLLPLIVKFDINSFDEENRITRLFKASA
jgi:hypothetical protein